MTLETRLGPELMQGKAKAEGRTGGRCANGMGHSEEETCAPRQPTTAEGQPSMQEAYPSEHLQKAQLLAY